MQTSLLSWQLLESRDAELSRCQSQLESLKSEESRLRNEISNSKAICDALSMSDEERLSKIESLTVELDRLSSDNRLLSRRAEESAAALKDHKQRSDEAGSVAHRCVQDARYALYGTRLD